MSARAFCCTVGLMPRRHHARARAVATLALAAILAPAALLLAQGDEVAFVISVFDSNGRPVRDLKRDEIVLTENGVAGEVVKVEPFIMPVELTVAVDNGPLSADALAHYRTGLAGLIRTLPTDVEVTFITMSPQPLMVVPPGCCAASTSSPRRRTARASPTRSSSSRGATRPSCERPTTSTRCRCW